jgi:predicted dehydrogenase
LSLLEAFPSISLFCEKPVTTGPVERISDTIAVRDELAKQKPGSIVGVGYMLRYLKACQDIK